MACGWKRETYEDSHLDLGSWAVLLSLFVLVFSGSAKMTYELEINLVEASTKRINILGMVSIFSEMFNTPESSVKYFPPKHNPILSNILVIPSPNSYSYCISLEAIHIHSSTFHSLVIIVIT